MTRARFAIHRSRNLFLIALLTVCFVFSTLVEGAFRGSKGGSIDSVYQRWLAGQPVESQAQLRIPISSARGLTPPSRARGVLEANLDSGEITVRIRRLGQTADVWLVDNKPGAGASILPESGDDVRRLGSLALRGLDSELSTRVAPEFFQDFQIDLVVVTSVGETPFDERLLLGATSTFDRRRLRERSGRPPRDPPDGRVAQDPRVQLGLVSPEVLVGGALFFRGTFGGNGRTCGTCHPVENNLTIDAEFIEALARKNPRDPLFVAEAGHPNHVPGLEVPDLLRQFGLILENVDGLEAPEEKFLLRSVPHSLSMATSIVPPLPDPNAPDAPLADGSTLQFMERTGWSGDGAPAPGTLRMFQVGAVIQHYTKSIDRFNGSTNFLLPNDEELDAIEAYLLTTGRTTDLDLSSIVLNEPQAEAGRLLFSGAAKCSGCHANAGANFANAGGNRNLNTGSETARIPEVDARNIPLDGGFGGQNEPSFNFDSDGDGLNDSYGNGSFNTPPLIEAADTAPFFHTNAFNTIEEAVAFYTSDVFANSPSGRFLQSIDPQGIAIQLDDQQIAEVGAFLRVLNAAFNLAMAEQRLAAALAIDEANGKGRSRRQISDRLVELASVELLDARKVLGRNGLDKFGHRLVRTAIHESRNSIGVRNSTKRRRAIERALEQTIEARQRLGTGLEFELGEGNLVF